MRVRLVILALAVTSVTANAQWLKLPTPGMPRLPDGKPNLEAPAPRTADGKPDLSGLWRNDGGDRLYNNIAADLKPGDVAPWADAIYQKRKLEFGKDSMETLCLPMGPQYLTTRFRRARIVQTPALIVLMFDDLVHRSIWMDGRSLETDPNPTWLGYSVGRWEGDTLVVESNGFTDRSWLDFDGHPHTEELRITERYSRTTVGRIDRQATLTDPKAYTRPIQVSVPLKLQPDTELIESVCENNRSLERMTAVTAAQPVSVPASTLSRYVGTYDVVDDDGAKSTVEVTMSGTTLWLEYAAKGKEPLLPLSATRFSWSGTIVEFSTPKPGTTHLLIRYVEGDERGPKRQK